MQQYIATAIKKDVNNPTPEGETPAVGVDVYVYVKSTGALATIYIDNGVTQKTQPLITDSNGRVEFYAANGRYNIEYNLPSGIQTDEDIILYDPEGSSDLSITSAAMTKAEFDALAEQRKRVNAGSGFLEWGKHYPDKNTGIVVNEGIWCQYDSSSVNRLNVGTSDGRYGVSRTSVPIALVNGVQHRIYGIDYSFDSNNPNKIMLPPAPDGTKTYDSATGGVVQHVDVATAFASETATNKVITSRKDLVFLESWHEAIEDKDQVYWLGNVQQGVDNPYGAPNLTRSDGYTRFGEWDTTTTGKYSTWSALTDAQKLAFIQDQENNIYYDSEVGKFIQVRYRVRVVEGKYNYQSRGDAYTDAGLTTTDGDAGLLEYNEFKVIPIALVQRFNQGAYHPTVNPSGCARFSDNNFWYNTTDTVASTQDCFELALNGDIASAITGRTDKYKYYDAIYAGLVEDLRLPATKQDYARLAQDRLNKAIAGTVRGKERLPFTKVFPSVGAVEAGYTIVNQDNPAAVVAESYSMLTAEYDSLPWVDIIGNPTNIAATFPDGVIGQWISELPSSSLVTYPLNKKSSGTTLTRLFTSNNGNSWSITSVSVDNIDNSFSNADGLNLVSLNYYEALSNHTQASNRNAVEYDDLDTFASSSYLVNNGNRLAGSTVGVIGKINNEDANQGAKINAVQYKLDVTFKLSSVKHSSIDSTPNAGSGTKGIKSTPYLVQKDGLLYVQYLSQEIEHDGTDWGDSGFVQIVDGDGTYVNDNGATLKASCHTDIIPIAIADYTETNK